MIFEPTITLGTFLNMVTFIIAAIVFLARQREGMNGLRDDVKEIKRDLKELRDNTIENGKDIARIKGWREPPK